MKGNLYGVSVGPGDPDLLTLRAAKVLRACKVIAYPAKRAGAVSVAFEIAAQAVEGLREKELVELVFPMTHDANTLQEAWHSAAGRICAFLAEGKDVAFPILGDASIYSTYAHIHNAVKLNGFTCETIAGVPSFCAAAARLGEGLTETDKPLHLIPAGIDDLSAALDWPGSKVLMKPCGGLREVKSILREKGLYDSARMICRCGMPGERVYESLDEAGDTADYFSIILIKEGE